NPNPATVGETVTFTNTSTGADSYAWDFGDGVGTSSDANPTYTYTSAGTYTVTVTATGPGGTQTVVQDLIVMEPIAEPQASFSASPNPGVVGEVVTFNNTSTDADTFVWDFGDGAGTSSEFSPTYTYTSAGTYTVTLTATGAGGTNSITQSIVIEDSAPSAPTGPLTFISNMSGNLDIFVADGNGQNPVNITNTPFDEFEAVWSPDGTKIAYASTEFGDFDIFIFDLNTMTRTQITTSGANDRQPAWSPDGSQLAFASDRNNLNVNNDIFVVNVSDLNAGTFNPTALIASPTDEQQPTWSPDGNQIAYMSDAAGADTNNIYVVSIADTSNPTQITFSNADNQPNWSSNGVIAFTSGRDGNQEIYRINSNGDNELRLTQNGDGINDRIPIWSPDGSRLYYTSNLATDGSGGASNLNIYVMNADGTGQSPITAANTDEANGNTR
ncbi:MAG: PKD domain-containing protein, partial [Anaerolineae bacterium]